MAESRRYYHGGKTLVVDRLVELKRSSSLEAMKSVIGIAMNQRELERLRDELENMGADGVISPAEKQSLKREWGNLESSYYKTSGQFSDDPDLSGSAPWSLLAPAFATLSSIMEKVLADMDSSYTGADLTQIDDLFYSCWTYINRCSALYDSRSSFGSRYELRFVGNREFNGSTTINVVVYSKTLGQNVAFPASEFDWYYSDTGDKVATGTPNPTFTTAMLGSATSREFWCQWTHDISSETGEESGTSVARIVAFITLSIAKITQFQWSNAEKEDQLNKDSSAWSNTRPDQPDGVQYVWIRESEDDGKTWTYYRETGLVGPEGPQGEAGPQGPQGWSQATVTLYKRSQTEPGNYDGGVLTYTFATGALSGDMGTWSNEMPEGSDPLWAIYGSFLGQTASDTIQPGEWTSPAKVSVEGTQGQAGMSVAIVFIYQRAASAPALPTGDVTYSFTNGQLSVEAPWSQTVPSGSLPCYVSSATASSRTSSAVISPSRWAQPVILVQDGEKGDKGDKGDTGATGVGIASISNHYLASAAGEGVTTSTPGWTDAVQSMSAAKKYLWNYETISYTDGASTDSEPCIIGTYGEKGDKGDTGAQGPQGDKGDKGDTGATGPQGPQGDQGDTGAAGNGIASISEHYSVSSSNTTAPSAWQDTPPAMTASLKYLWNYETINYTDGTSMDTAKRVIGAYGDKGDTGATGPQGPQGPQGDKGDAGEDAAILSLSSDMQEFRIQPDGTPYPGQVATVTVTKQGISDTTEFIASNGMAIADGSTEIKVTPAMMGLGRITLHNMVTVDTTEWAYHSGWGLRTSCPTLNEDINAKFYLRGKVKYSSGTLDDFFLREGGGGGYYVMNPVANTEYTLSVVEARQEGEHSADYVNYQLGCHTFSSDKGVVVKECMCIDLTELEESFPYFASLSDDEKKTLLDATIPYIGAGESLVFDGVLTNNVNPADNSTEWQSADNSYPIVIFPYRNKIYADSFMYGRGDYRYEKTSPESVNYDWFKFFFNGGNENGSTLSNPLPNTSYLYSTTHHMYYPEIDGNSLVLYNGDRDKSKFKRSYWKRVIAIDLTYTGAYLFFKLNGMDDDAIKTYLDALPFFEDTYDIGREPLKLTAIAGDYTASIILGYVQDGGSPQYWYQYTDTPETEPTYDGWTTTIPQGAEYSGKHLWIRIVNPDGTETIVPPASVCRISIQGAQTYQADRSVASSDQTLEFAVVRDRIEVGDCQWSINAEAFAAGVGFKASSSSAATQTATGETAQVFVPAGFDLKQFTVTALVMFVSASVVVSEANVTPKREYLGIYPQTIGGVEYRFPITAKDGKPLAVGDSVTMREEDAEGNATGTDVYVYMGIEDGQPVWTNNVNEMPSDKIYEIAMDSNYDISSLANQQKLEPVAQGAAWLFQRNIVAFNMFAQRMFAEEIIIQAGGSIHSNTYDGDGNRIAEGPGFYLGDDGVFKAVQAELVDIVATNGSFSGQFTSSAFKTVDASDAISSANVKDEYKEFWDNATSSAYDMEFQYNAPIMKYSNSSISKLYNISAAEDQMAYAVTYSIGSTTRLHTYLLTYSGQVIERDIVLEEYASRDSYAIFADGNKGVYVVLGKNITLYNWIDGSSTTTISESILHGLSTMVQIKKFEDTYILTGYLYNHNSFYSSDMISWTEACSCFYSITKIGDVYYAVNVAYQAGYVTELYKGTDLNNMTKYIIKYSQGESLGCAAYDICANSDGYIALLFERYDGSSVPSRENPYFIIIKASDITSDKTLTGDDILYMDALAYPARTESNGTRFFHMSRSSGVYYDIIQEGSGDDVSFRREVGTISSTDLTTGGLDPTRDRYTTPCVTLTRYGYVCPGSKGVSVFPQAKTSTLASFFSSIRSKVVDGTVIPSYEPLSIMHEVSGTFVDLQGNTKTITRIRVYGNGLYIETDNGLHTYQFGIEDCSKYEITIKNLVVAGDDASFTINNMLPMDDGVDIGNEENKFHAVHAETVYSDVNEEGTQNKVWGAVFN